MAPPPHHPLPNPGMITRSQRGIFKPNPKYHALHTEVSQSPLPRNPIAALRDSNWKLAMDDEYQALMKNNTWDLVPRPPGINVIRSMWIFTHKFNSNGVFERHKARLVGDGKTQQVGIDCGDTFSPVVKPATVRTVLSISLSKSCPIHQLDVKNAFLHGELQETVYMHQPLGYRDRTHPDYVCLLRKSIYGIKQASRTWYKRFADYVLSLGFTNSRCDTSLFIYKQGSDMAYILVYVDDIILTTSSHAFRRSIMASLISEFVMKDLGPLNYFLGIVVTRHKDDLFLSQRKYAEKIVERAGMTSCKPSATPVDTKSKISATSGTPVADPTHYRRLAGALQYLTITRPNISYAVQQICLHMHDPRTYHTSALKRIICYVQGTLDQGLHLYPSSVSSLVSYTDADWGVCLDTRRSTSGYCVFLGDNLLSWSSKRQPTLSLSSAEAEYRGVAKVVSESCWLRNLLLELHCPIPKATLVYCDNVSAIYLSGNPVQHQMVARGQFVVNYNMNEFDKTPTELLHMLRTYETNMKTTELAPILMVGNKGKAKWKGKWKGKKKIGSDSTPKPKSGPKLALKPKGGVAKGECHYCKKAGHWKRNCPIYLEDLKKMKAVQIFGSGLQRRRTLAKGEVDLRVGNGAKVAALAIETYYLSMPSGLILELEDCFYVPAIRRNIISVSYLDKKDKQHT
ncbi:hypothetical protein AgCh_022791 [Apium graveolens]